MHTLFSDRNFTYTSPSDLLILPEIMLDFYQRRYGVKDIAHVLYGLAYFDDAEREKAPILSGNLNGKM
jgi:hypothetical protein